MATLSRTEAPPSRTKTPYFASCGAYREVALGDGENLLGRDAGAAVSIDDATVSRHHARIVVHDGGAVLEDLGSKNGTRLNGARIVSSRPLADGDEIRVGPAALTFRRFPATGSTETVLP